MTDKVHTRCVNDTNGDGDCAACARNPQAPCRIPVGPDVADHDQWRRRWLDNHVLEIGDA